MNEKIFEIFKDWDDEFNVRSHFEIMRDFPSLTSWTQYNVPFELYRKQLNGMGLYTRSDIILWFKPQKAEGLSDYLNRISSIAPFNVCKHAIDSVVGLMTRKPPQIANEAKEGEEGPEVEFLKTVTGEQDWTEAIRDKLYPAMFSGIGGILVDITDKGRIIWDIYDAESISKKHLAREQIEGEEYLKRVVLVSTYDREKEDAQFEYEKVKKALILKLVDISETEVTGAGFPAYTRGTDPDNFAAVYEIWEQGEKDKDVVLKKSGVFRSRTGQVFNYLPFFLVAADKKTFCPAFKAAEKIQFEYSNQESSFRGSLKISNFPMLVYKSDRNGLPEEMRRTLNADGETYTVEKTLTLSPQAVFEIGENDDLLWLEHQCHNYEATQRELELMRYQITAAIVNKLSDQATQRTKAQFEGEQMTNTAPLIPFVSSGQSAIQAAATASIFFLGLPPEKAPIIELNKDFIREIAESGLMVAIKDSWLDGLISGDTAIKILQDKEILDLPTNFKLEQEKIQEERTMSGTEPVRGNVEPPKMDENESDDE